MGYHVPVLSLSTSTSTASTMDQTLPCHNTQVCKHSYMYMETISKSFNCTVSYSELNTAMEIVTK